MKGLSKGSSSRIITSRCTPFIERVISSLQPLTCPGVACGKALRGVSTSQSSPFLMIPPAEPLGEVLSQVAQLLAIPLEHLEAVDQDGDPFPDWAQTPTEVVLRRRAGPVVHFRVPSTGQTFFLLPEPNWTDSSFELMVSQITGVFPLSMSLQYEGQPWHMGIPTTGYVDVEIIGRGGM